MPAAAKLPAAVKIYRELLVKLSWRTIDGAENHLQYVPPVSLPGAPLLKVPAVQFRTALASRFQAIEDRLSEKVDRVKSAAALLPFARRLEPPAADASDAAAPSQPPASSSSSSPADAPKHSYGDPEASPLEELLRPAVLAALGGASRVFMSGLNTVKVSGGERLSWAVLDRPEGQGLLTVCNHVSALDDPLVLAAAIPAEVIARPDRMRWTMCAAERCFHRKLLGSLLKSAKVLPIERGAGLGQPGVVAAERRLARGDWVHIFPEGTRAADPERLGVVRRGVGRLYVEACERARRESPGPSGRAPLLLPFVHRGMERINSRGKAGLGVGHEVEVVVGEPIDLEPLLDSMASRGATRDELYEAVAEEVAHSLRVLHAGLFGYDPEPHPRRHLTAAEGAAASRALFSASASAGPWAAAYESFPPRPHPGFAASAAASPAGASSSGGGGGVVGSSKSLGGLGWGRRSSGCVLGDFDVASEAGAGDSGDPPAWGRGGGLPGGTDAAAAFFAPPQDDLWWYAAKTQALQRAGRGTVPFAAAGALAALVEGVDGRSCWSGAAAAAAARGDMASC